MISKQEQAVLDFLQKYMIFLVIGATIVINIIMRVSVKDCYNDDLVDSLLPWYEAIKNGGGFKAIGAPIEKCNYNLPYLSFIAFFTYLPMYPVYLYKLLSSIFDYLMGLIVARFVYEFTGNKSTAAVSFCITIMSPVVIFNSAVWGQCDSMYTFFILVALYYLYKEKHFWSFVFLGAAFAFKLQTIFVFPLFAFYYFYRKKFSILYFAIIPVVMEILSLPAIIMGRGLLDTFRIYFDQTDDWEEMSMNFPSFWLIPNNTTSGVNTYSIHKTLAIFTAVFLLGLYMYLCVKHQIKLEKINLLYGAIISIFTCVEFLPSMHERYAYTIELLFIILVFVNIKYIIFAVAINSFTLMLYSHFLYKTWIQMEFITWVYLAMYVAIVVFLGKRMKNYEELREEENVSTNN